MIITKDKVVSLEYTLKDKDGTILDTSEGTGPLEYVHGRGNLIPGLEKELEGKKEGDILAVEVCPEDAYGEYSDDLVIEVPKSNFEAGTEIKVGMQFESGDSAGRRIVTVTKVANDAVTIDANHELAGKTLFFDVKIEGIRDATGEELSGSGSCGCGGHDSCSDDNCGCSCSGCSGCH